MKLTNIPFLWQLPTMPPALELVKILKEYNMTHANIKVANGFSKFNEALLPEYANTLHDSGIEIIFWAYIYPVSVENAATVHASILNKYPYVSTFFLDVEKEWKQTGLDTAARKYVETLRSKTKRLLKLGFCSYRYPSYHPPINYRLWIDLCDFVAPQVYWLGASNPAEQLTRTYEEHAILHTKITPNTFWPMASFFGAAVGSSYWMPTDSQIAEFYRWCKEHEVPNTGFWSLDWVLGHNKYSWLEQIPKAEIPPATDPPIPSLPKAVVLAASLSLRSSPVVSSSTYKRSINHGTIVEALDIYFDVNGNKWLRIMTPDNYGGWSCMTYYGTPLMAWNAPS